MTECGAGTYSSRARALECTPCGDGQYQDEQGKTACKPCVGMASEDRKSCGPCPAGQYFDTVANKCSAITGFAQSRFDELETAASGCKTGTLEPGLYRAVLVGGTGGAGGYGDRLGGAGGAGGKLTYNFEISEDTAYTLCVGATGGATGVNRAICGSSSICNSYARCGGGGIPGTKSSLTYGGTTLVAGGGGGGGGSGGYYKGSLFCKSTHSRTGENGHSAESPGGAGGSSVSNGNGNPGGNGSSSPASNVGDVQSCGGPCAKLYKLK